MPKQTDWVIKLSCLAKTVIVIGYSFTTTSVPFLLNTTLRAKIVS